MRPLSFGLAGGILWGISVAALTVCSLLTGYANLFMTLVADIYPGYSVSWPGVAIGGVYGFFDGFLGLYILAWLYNRFE